MARRTMKLTLEERVAFVQRCINKEISCLGAAKEAGVGSGTMDRWVSFYKTGGAAALEPRQQNAHYPQELKLAAVQDYLAGKGNMTAIVKKYHLRNNKLLQEWIKVYNTRGNFYSESERKNMRKARETTTEERLKIAQDCLIHDKAYSMIAEKYQVSYQQTRHWTLKYEEMGVEGLEDRRGKQAGTASSRTKEEAQRDQKAQLERRVRELEMENDLLKKVKEIERRF